MDISDILWIYYSKRWKRACIYIYIRIHSKYCILYTSCILSALNVYVTSGFKHAYVTYDPVAGDVTL